MKMLGDIKYKKMPKITPLLPDSNFKSFFFHSGEGVKVSGAMNKIWIVGSISIDTKKKISAIDCIIRDWDLGLECEGKEMTECEGNEMLRRICGVCNS